MHKVIAVNLNGNAYQVEEPGYHALRAYLDHANATLGDNPDRAEIVADLEQAIADKCGRTLAAHKTVVTAAEVGHILAEMGPVDGAAAAAAGDAQPVSGAAAGAQHEEHPFSRKRLYAVYDGAWLFGICNGIGAYFDVDPIIVRVIFVVLAFATGGFWILVYVALMFILPVARTPEEHAAAHGIPFNAHELVRRAKAKYAEIYEQRGIRREWKRHRRAWRLQRRAWRAQWRGAVAGGAPWSADAAPPPSYGAHVLAGAFTPVLIVLGVALFFAFATATISLLLTGRVLQWSPPSDLPLWAGVLILFLFYQLIAWPLHAARRATHMVLARGSAPRLGLEGVVGFAFGLLCLWFVYQEVPAVHDFLRDIPGASRTMFENLRDSWH